MMSVHWLSYLFNCRYLFIILKTNHFVTLYTFKNDSKFCIGGFTNTFSMDDNVRESYGMAIRKDLKEKKTVNIESSSTVLSVSLHEVNQCNPCCERFLFVKIQAGRYEMQHSK